MASGVARAASAAGPGVSAAGWDAGAGVEYFFTPEATVTLEALFHKVELIPTPRATLGFKGSFWAFTIGAKKYF